MIHNITCAGGIFLARSTQRFLFLLRAQDRIGESWGIAGGKKEPSDNTPYDTLLREITEELGSVPKIEKTIPIEWYESTDQLFYYNTYVLITENEFIPILNEEHSGWAWCSWDHLPKPLHRGLKTTLNSRITRAKIETILRVVK
jgi:8-oxo-dGTP pyrophosphatase MutT (NUDIX family)